jgi:hypothetical protein
MSLAVDGVFARLQCAQKNAQEVVTAGSFEQLCRELKVAYQKTKPSIIGGNYFLDECMATSGHSHSQRL